MKKVLPFIIALLSAGNLFAQNIGIGTTTPNTSAMLDIIATNKGLLIPRVALADVNDIVTIASPSTSLLIYNTATAGVIPFTVTPGFYYWNSTAWIPFVVNDNSTKAAWLLGGNKNTSTVNNFIGTSDIQPLLFKIRNTNAGYLGLDGNTYWGYKSGINNTGYSNVAIGGSALFQNTNRSNLMAVGDSALYNNGVGATTISDATENTALGSKALYANTIGAANTAVGKQALFANTTAINNTAVGAKALFQTTIGNNNTAVGVLSLASNNIGHENTAIGVQALVSNTIGLGNTASGYQSLYNNTKGSNNVANGFQSLVYNTTGDGNIAVGNYALFSNGTGHSNIAIGIQTLANNTTQSNIVAVGDSALYFNGLGATGFQAATGNTAIGSKTLYSNTIGYSNTAMGFQALYSNTQGSGNTAYGQTSLLGNSIGSANSAFGYGALLSSIDADNNVAIGASSMYQNTQGNNNTAIGYGSLISNHIGANNTAIGFLANVSSVNLSNATVIGSNATVSNSNSMVFGDGNVTTWAFGRTSAAAGNALQVGTNATNGNAARLTAGGVWTNASDSAKKDGITKLDGADILSKIKQLSITRWKYKGTDEYHIGPMAQDFYRLFNVGTDDKSISSIDPAGIALKAIQTQQEEIDLLKQQIILMNATIEKLKGNN